MKTEPLAVALLVSLILTVAVLGGCRRTDCDVRPSVASEQAVSAATVDERAPRQETDVEAQCKRVAESLAMLGKLLARDAEGEQLIWGEVGPDPKTEEMRTQVGDILKRIHKSLITAQVKVEDDMDRLDELLTSRDQTGPVLPPDVATEIKRRRQAVRTDGSSK